MSIFTLPKIGLGTWRMGGNVAMESKTLPYCQENGVYVVAERPLERGSLLERHPLMEEISRKYGKSYVEIAINWLVSQPYVVTVPKSETPQRQQENLNAGTWEMDADDIEQLRAAYLERADAA